MANATLPSGFLKSVLHNGVGRYVCQLQRITFKFCKSFGSSKGMRDFIERDLVDFARNNPGVVVYLKPRRHRTPVITAEYLNGHTDYVNCRKFSREDVLKYVEYVKNKSGYPIVRLRKLWHTDNPSIQGVWTPFSNLDPEISVCHFPNEDLSAAKQPKISATEILKAMETKKAN